MSRTEIVGGIDTEEFYLSRMLEHDLLEVCEIEERCGLSLWGWDAYHTELTKKDESIMLVARHNGDRTLNGQERIAGFVAARMVADELHVNNMAVRDSFRRRGLGATLLEAALCEARGLGARKAILEVRAGNEAAQALYHRYGFKVVGRRERYYTNPPEDALVMGAALRTEA